MDCEIQDGNLPSLTFNEEHDLVTVLLKNTICDYKINKPIPIVY